MQAKPNTFQAGDRVKRKGDTSGRTRRVASVDGDTIFLETPLDGWLVWDAKDLELVESETVAGDAANEAHPNRRTSLPSTQPKFATRKSVRS